MSAPVVNLFPDDVGLVESMARHPSRFIPEGVASCDLCGESGPHGHDWDAEFARDENDERWGPS